MTVSVDELRGVLESYLNEHFGAYHVDDEGDFFIEYESARVFVCPRTWSGEGQSHTVVQLFSVTNVDVPVTDELTRFLATQNLNLLFGHFALRDDQVWFGHTLLGDFLDADELVTALSTVARTANRYDEEIKERFGGRLYTEAAP
ncbi:MAG: YbjN domain-containing protein [Actinobacteria bacterium]|nr:YbjN domain-containing protein [Actinomycetota bacterium]